MAALKVDHAGEQTLVSLQNFERAYMFREHDFQLPERLEDLLDLQDAMKAIAEIESGTVSTVAWDKVKAEAGL